MSYSAEILTKLGAIGSDIENIKTDIHYLKQNGKKTRDDINGNKNRLIAIETRHIDEDKGEQTEGEKIGRSFIIWGALIGSSSAIIAALIVCQFV